MRTFAQGLQSRVVKTRLIGFLGLVFMMGALEVSAKGIVVKAGEHENFTRFVFYSKEPLQMTSAVKDGSVTLHMKTFEALDLSLVGKRIKSAPEINVQPEEQGQVLTIPVQEGAHVKQFIDRGMVVVDVYGQISSSDSGSSKSHSQGKISPALQVPGSTLNPAHKTSDSAVKSLVTAANKNEIIVDASAHLHSNPKQQIRTLKDILERLNKGASVDQADGALQEKNIKKKLVKLRIRKQGERDLLILSTPKPFPMAIMQREGASWIFIDTTAAPLWPVVSPHQAAEYKLDVWSKEGFVCIRIDKPVAIAPSYNHHETVFTFLKEPREPGQIVSCDRLYAEDGAQLKFYIKAKKAFEWVDPDVGDTLLIVPSLIQEIGMNRKVYFVDMHLLPSMQGLVIKKRADDLFAFFDDEELIVSRPSGLRLKLEDDGLYAVGTLGSIFQFEDIVHKQDRPFFQERETLQQDLIQEKRPKADLYFDYGRFLMLIGYFKEAQGAFRSALIHGKDQKRQWLVEGYLGLTAMLQGQYKEAQKAFFATQLHKLPEILFLQDVIESRLNDEKKKVENIADTLQFLQRYPDSVRARLGVLVLPILMKSKEIGLAEKVLELMRQTHISSVSLQEEIAYFQAQLYMEQGLLDQGQQALKALRNATNTRIRSRAEFMYVIGEWEEKKISDQEALAQLDKLRILLRSGSEYRDIVDFLCRILIKNNKYSEALNCLRQAYDKADSPSDKLYYAQKISTAILEVFSSQSLDKISVLPALAIFAEYQSFLQSREDFQSIIYSLLDRLEQVDLLGPATDILERRINTFAYAKVDDKVKDQLRLVRLCLGQEKVDLGLAWLDKIKGDTLTEMKSQYNDLRLKALVMGQRFSEALNLLEGQESIEALIKKAMVYWSMNDWGNVAQQMEAILNHPASAEERDASHDEMVIMLATAYNLSEQKEKLALMKERFQKQMENSPLKNDFDLLTAPEITKSFATVTDIERTLDQLDIYQQYMQNKSVQPKKIEGSY